jgi:hypothetical protein
MLVPVWLECCFPNCVKGVHAIEANKQLTELVSSLPNKVRRCWWWVWGGWWWVVVVVVVGGGWVGGWVGGWWWWCVCVCVSEC